MQISKQELEELWSDSSLRRRTGSFDKNYTDSVMCSEMYVEAMNVLFLICKEQERVEH